MLKRLQLRFTISMNSFYVFFGRGHKEKHSRLETISRLKMSSFGMVLSSQCCCIYPLGFVCVCATTVELRRDVLYFLSNPGNE